MDHDPMNQVYQAQGFKQETLPQYVAKTYLWMFAGLLVTFVVSALTISTGAVFYVIMSPYALTLLTIAELVVVIWMSVRVNRLSVGAARGMFLLYAVLNGVVFSSFFLLYDVATLTLVFAATALFFGLMSAVSYFGKVDLTKYGPILFAGLIVLIVFGVLSMFLRLEALDTAMCYLGIIVFLGFTAYDTGKIRANYNHFSGNPEILQKASIFSALSLYLDFINLFLYLLRLLGRRR